MDLAEIVYSWLAILYMILAIAFIILGFLASRKHIPEWLEPAEGMSIDDHRNSGKAIMIVGIVMIMAYSGAYTYLTFTIKPPRPNPTQLTYELYAKGVFDTYNRHPQTDGNQEVLDATEWTSPSYPWEKGSNASQGKWKCWVYHLYEKRF